MLCNRKNRSARKGIVVVLVALGLVGIISVVALTVDGGMLQLDYRKARAHADASAMAGACVLYKNYPKQQGKDVDGEALVEAKNTAAKNGVKNDNVTSKLVVNIPPQSGPYKGMDSYIEVTVTYYVTRGFSRIFGSGTIPVEARAVARGAWVAPKAGVILLDYDDRASLNSQGNGAFTETGAPVIVNSNNPSATVSAGNGVLKAQEFYITGGLTVSGGGSLVTEPVANQIFTGMHPTPDPLAYLPVPNMPADGTMTKTSLGKGNWSYLLTPGRYTNLPNFNTGDIVIFQPASTNGGDGIYYIDGGGLHSTGATLTMGAGSGGIMIYNRPTDASNSQKVQITGNPAGTVNLSGLTSGPYSGMVLWQDRKSDAEMLVEGNGNFSIQGTLYAAGALLNVNGNGKTAAGDITGFYYDEAGNKIAGSSRIASQYVSKNLSLGGNGNVRLDYSYQSVAKTRVIALVE
jgi:hypothetical protein